MRVSDGCFCPRDFEASLRPYCSVIDSSTNYSSVTKLRFDNSPLHNLLLSLAERSTLNPSDQHLIHIINIVPVTCNPHFERDISSSDFISFPFKTTVRKSETPIRVCFVCTRRFEAGS